VIRFEKKSSVLDNYKIQEVVYKTTNIEPIVRIRPYLDTKKTEESLISDNISQDSICVVSSLKSAGLTKAQQWLKTITLPNDSLLSNYKKVKELFYNVDSRRVHVSNTNKPDTLHKEYSIAQYYQHLNALPYSQVNLHPSIPSEYSMKAKRQENNVWKAKISFSQNFGGLKEDRTCDYCDLTIKNIDIYILINNKTCESFLGDILVEKTLSVIKYNSEFIPKQ
jgi:hypothetical protein